MLSFEPREKSSWDCVFAWWELLPFPQLVLAKEILPPSRATAAALIEFESQPFFWASSGVGSGRTAHFINEPCAPEVPGKSRPKSNEIALEQ
jgi:hypothetical protein